MCLLTPVFSSESKMSASEKSSQFLYWSITNKYLNEFLRQYILDNSFLQDNYKQDAILMREDDILLLQNQILILDQINFMMSESSVKTQQFVSDDKVIHLILMRIIKTKLRNQLHKM